MAEGMQLCLFGGPPVPVAPSPATDEDEGVPDDTPRTPLHGPEVLPYIHEMLPHNGRPARHALSLLEP